VVKKQGQEQFFGLPLLRPSGLAALPGWLSAATAGSSGWGPTGGTTGSALGNSTTTALAFSALSCTALATSASTSTAARLVLHRRSTRQRCAPQRLLRRACALPAQFDLLDLLCRPDLHCLIEDALHLLDGGNAT